MKHLLLFCIILFGGWLGFSSDAAAVEKRLIAVIVANSQPRYHDIHTAFVKRSREFCGENCQIYVQTPNADIMSLRNSVRKAVALGAELIVTYGPAATLAAKAEVPPIPTIFADVYDPVHLGLISAKTRTGRNMTGIRGDAPVQALFKYFVQATQAKKLVVLYNTNSQEGLLQKSVLQASGEKKGIVIIPLAVENNKDHVAPLRDLPTDVDGLFLACSELADSHLKHVMEFAATRHLPVITLRAGAAELGAFMVLETSAVEQGEKLAEIAEQVLAGRKTDEIPMYKPRQVAFVINLKVAKEYGIHVPFQTLTVASRVVR
ncbi:MAG: ABC transporter substrate-binding protein [Candidatus Marinimicrobia bacterium]|nr:ABC transporter substrate-binding protein [Candidatus Neomarinimicrobiota bacterium]